jgi:luciferase family oxidoreductase group 1
MLPPLSVLDLVPLPKGVTSGEAIRRSVELAQHVERLGYRRVWYAEHHNMPTIASTTPEIMIALAANATSTIHVGSGGVMLPNHAPLKVAETFKMLESLHPGRIDLGIGRAPGTDPASAALLRGSRQALAAGDFPDRLNDLIALGEGPVQTTLGGGTVAAYPLDVGLPPIVLLGSSDYSAHLSASMGLAFGFAAHFSDMDPAAPMLAYRREFQKGPLEKPHAILTLQVVCADTEDEAHFLATSLLVSFARLRTGQRSVLLPPEEAAEYQFNPHEAAVAESIRSRIIAGTPDAVRARIAELAERTQADEVMVTTMIHGHEARLRSYELLAA